MIALRNFGKTLGKTALLAAFSLTLAGCAINPKDPVNADTSVSDPLQGLNRVTLALNEFLDKIIFNPLDTAYRTIVPQVARDGVHNVLDNVKSPVYLANELLQGDLPGAGKVVQRFMINTLVGGAGMVDVAGKTGITNQPEDFGQTLAKWGVGNGPYIVWPIMGPSTLRDSVGFVGDIAMDPLYWYAHNNDKPAIQWTRAGLTLVDSKDRYRNMMDDLRRNSGDLYTSLQSVYLQRRNALINDSDPKKTALPNME
jgi:phospholipid-binding lipoprotein MlaA